MGVDVKKNSGTLSEENKKKLTHKIESYFGKDNSALCQIGWCSQLNVDDKIPAEYEKFHRENFGSGNTLFLGFCEDGEEMFYINENGKLKKQSGYYVYFERNIGMQQYIEDNQPSKCVEMEPLDKGRSETYRMLLANHKEEIQHKHLVTFLYTASTFLVMVVIVLGITLINHYDKLRDMQDTIASLSKNVINGESDEGSITSGGGIVETGGTATGQSGTVPNASQEAVNISDSQGVGTGSSVDSASGDAVNDAGEDRTGSDEQQGDEADSNNEDNSEGDSGGQPEGDEDVQAANGTTAQEQEMMEQDLRRYEVVEGDTLIGICKKLYGSLEYLDKICEYNHIENSDQIKAGQKIWVP